MSATIHFDHNPVTWTQVGSAYPDGITLAGQTILPNHTDTLNGPAPTLAGKNSSGEIDVYNGHPFDYTCSAGAAVTIKGPITGNTTYFSVTVQGQEHPVFAFIHSHADESTIAAVWQTIQSAATD